MPGQTRPADADTGGAVPLRLVIAALVQAVREAAAIGGEASAGAGLQLQSCDMELAFLVEKTDARSGEQTVILDHSRLADARKAPLQRLHIHIDRSGTSTQGRK